MSGLREKTEQEKFWEKEYAEDYIHKNSKFDHQLGAQAWRKMLGCKASEIETFLECGCNIGRNLFQLGIVLPSAKASVIEISKPAFDHVSAHFHLDKSFNGPILESNFPEECFDLVFSMGVLIHIQPEDLLATMGMMWRYSKKYILMGEYFNRTPVMIEYQGQKNKLFKRDFEKLFVENFKCKIVDYGFHWGHIYDSAGFDDVTWWLFEKTK
jgi:pseudaminic acid biosynthesis-associated methylase